MTWSFTIGSLFGSELRVHATFLLLLAWIGTSAWLDSGPMDAIVNVAFVLALFACVVAHEFGHALVARKFGVKTPDITLLPIGGMARLERIPEDPRQEIAVALAGPAVNLGLWLVLSLILEFGNSVASLARIDDPAQGFIERLAAVNLFLVVFNLIPAFPMDGGRVLRALLAVRLNRSQATRIAASAGQVIAFGFGYLGLTTGNPLLLLIAVFVFMAAMAESSYVTLHDLTRGHLAREAIITSYESLEVDSSMGAAEAALLRSSQTEFPVLGSDGHLRGFLTKAAIVANANSDTATRSVGDAMISDVPEVKLNDPLEAALDALQESRASVVAVTSSSGQFAGYVTRENVGEWMILSRSQYR